LVLAPGPLRPTTRDFFFQLNSYGNRPYVTSSLTRRWVLREIFVIQLRGGPHRKHRFLYCCVLIHCCRNMFTAPLSSNACGADHRKHCSSIVALVRFRGNVLTEPLPSNELFPLSYVMSQHKISIFPLSKVLQAPTNQLILRPKHCLYLFKFKYILCSCLLRKYEIIYTIILLVDGFAT
jgi:hypothetical protein